MPEVFEGESKSPEWDSELAGPEYKLVRKHESKDPSPQSKCLLCGTRQRLGFDDAGPFGVCMNREC